MTLASIFFLSTLLVSGHISSHMSIGSFAASPLSFDLEITSGVIIPVYKQKVKKRKAGTCPFKK
jgi:hypothetical protein